MPAIHAYWHVALKRDAVQHPLHVQIGEIARPLVRRGAVVPEGDAARLPAKARGVLGAGDFLEEQIQQVAAFLFIHVLDAAREARVHEQRALARFG
ncbi:hypothetical protein G6F35_012742 [Rhizopus arrhizus]|nr:hypothetical protein G6F35_012742 [Rhizopus arrhizus]KAG1253629.1 hypothetical protein G6F65_017385 [Rhizopus arrhizus]